MLDLGEDEWPNSDNLVVKKLIDLEESLRCPICGEFYVNPQILVKCGHCYCFECISRHFDQVLNPTTSTKCPSCRVDASITSMVNCRILTDVVQRFRVVRKDLQSIADSINKLVDSKTVSALRISESGNVVNSVVIKRLPPISFHGMSRDKVKKILEELCKGCKIKLRTDGDKDILARRHRDFVHLNNSQCSSANPMTLDEIIQEINRREHARELESNRDTKTSKIIEKLRKGEVILDFM